MEEARTHEGSEPCKKDTLTRKEALPSLHSPMAPSLFTKPINEHPEF